MPLEVICRSEDETAGLAGRLAGLLVPGEAVFLSGPLGAGKTFFIRAAARRLGVARPVTSPSYTLGHTYEGRVTVHHLDLYRLARFEGEDYADFEPFFEKSAITFVEWPERARRYLREPAAWVRLSHVDDHSRRVVIDGLDEARAKRLREPDADTGD